jgi:hypothetical protein
MLKAPKHRYSGKVRALGYGIILLEIATVALLFLAVYSNARVVTSVASSLYSIKGNGFGLENYTSNGQVEHAFVIPNVSNNGYLTVTMSVNWAFFNSLGNTVGNPLSESISIAPGQSQPLVLPIGLSIRDISGISGVHISLGISSISGLVGGGLSVTYTR